MPPKPEKRRTSKPKQSAQQPATPLDARQRALHEELEKIKLREEKLKRLIKDAPRLAELEQKRRREELVSRSMERPRRIDSPTRLNDTRYAASVAEFAPTSRNRPRKALRTQQRQARLIFFGLLFALIILVLWLWSVWKW